MRPSRGMGAIKKTKIPGATKNTMPKGVVKKRRDDTDFTESIEGGDVKMAGGGLYANIAAKKKRIAQGSGEKMRSVGSAGAPKKDDFANAAKTASYKEGGKVNEAGNYTKPGLRKRIFNSIKASAVQGTGAGQWSARKAQLMAKRYKAAGGGYK